MEIQYLDKRSDLTHFLEGEKRDYLKPAAAAKLLGISIKTIYDWKYRAKSKGIPDDMFFNLRRGFLIRSDVLKEWVIGRKAG